MRVLVLSDIHSNWVALRAVVEELKGEFDTCLCVGDIVDYGTDPVPCVGWIREHASFCVRGNHDHAIAQRVPTRSGSGLKQLAWASRALHWSTLTPRDIRWLAQLPVTERFRIGQKSFYMVHATPRDPMDEYLTAEPEEWKARLNGNAADFVLVGHTHVPYVLDLGATTIINPGSVGQPRDGDQRASCVLIEDGKPEIVRVEYDVAAAVAQTARCNVPEGTVELMESVLRSGCRSFAD